MPTPSTDPLIFRELNHVNLVASASSGHGRERLRRQSSGSSFYSKSDVDSEFSKLVTIFFGSSFAAIILCTVIIINDRSGLRIEMLLGEF